MKKQLITMLGIMIAVATPFSASSQTLPDVEFLATDQTITTSSGVPISEAISSGGPILDSDSVPLVGNLDVIFTLSESASNTYVVEGESVSPGTSITLKHDFTASNGHLNLAIYVEGAGTISSDDYDLKIINPGLLAWKVTTNNASYNHVSATADDKIFIRHYEGTYSRNLLQLSSTGEQLSYLRKASTIYYGTSDDGAVALYEQGFGTIAMMDPSSGAIENSFVYNPGSYFNVDVSGKSVYFYGGSGGYKEMNLETGEAKTFATPNTVRRSCGNRLTSFPGYQVNVNNCGWLDVYHLGGHRAYFRSPAAADYAKPFFEGVLTPLYLVTNSDTYLHSNLPGFSGFYRKYNSSTPGTTFFPTGDALVKNESLYISTDNLLYIIPINDPANSKVSTKTVCNNGETFYIKSVHPNEKWAMGLCGDEMVVGVNLMLDSVYQPMQNPPTITVAVPESTSATNGILQTSVFPESPGIVLPPTEGVHNNWFELQ